MQVCADTSHGATFACLFVCLLLFYAIARVFQLYYCRDVMYEMRRRKPEPILSPTQEICNLPHNIGMVWEELAFDDFVSYTQQGNAIAVTGIRTPVPRVTYPRSNPLSYLPTHWLHGEATNRRSDLVVAVLIMLTLAGCANLCSRGDGTIWCAIISAYIFTFVTAKYWLSYKFIIHDIILSYRYIAYSNKSIYILNPLNELYLYLWTIIAETDIYLSPL